MSSVSCKYFRIISSYHTTLNNMTIEMLDNLASKDIIKQSNMMVI